MTWNLTTILILLAVLFAGYGIGLLEMHLRRAKKIRQLETALQAPPDVPQAAPQVSSTTPGLLHLSADDAGALHLEMDGLALDAPTAITAEQRRRLISLLTGIRPWVDGSGTAPAPNASPAPKPAAPAPSLNPKPVTPAPAVNPAVPAAAAAPVPDLPPPTSIVRQIDAILQHLLIGTPLESRRIRLAENLGGGVLVYVGTERYDGLDNVPDPQVAAAIRAAIAEWEKGVK